MERASHSVQWITLWSASARQAFGSFHWILFLRSRWSFSICTTTNGIRITVIGIQALGVHEYAFGLATNSPFPHWKLCCHWWLPWVCRSRNTPLEPVWDQRVAPGRDSNFAWCRIRMVEAFLRLWELAGESASNCAAPLRITRTHRETCESTRRFARSTNCSTSRLIRVGTALLCPGFVRIGVDTHVVKRCYDDDSAHKHKPSCGLRWSDVNGEES